MHIYPMVPQMPYSIANSSYKTIHKVTYYAIWNNTTYAVRFGLLQTTTEMSLQL